MFLFVMGPFLSAVAQGTKGVLDERLLSNYIASFNASDDEIYTNAIPNSDSADFLYKNIPLFECPDSDIERTYYFRWWTYRKHLRRREDGKGWVITEFLPNVSWAGAENTISCPLGHHIREGRWIRTPEYIDSYIVFMLKKGNINGPRAYLSWPAWAAVERVKVTGDRSLLIEHLPDFIRNWEAWATGWSVRGLSIRDVTGANNYKGPRIKTGFRTERGLFDVAGCREGTEFALSVDGARPLVNSAMWAEAMAIAAVAREVGDWTTADCFAKRAADLEWNIKNKLWNSRKKFFTVLSVEGVLDDVCELHGYAPFYFGMELKGFEDAWKVLVDERGFKAPRGLTFPARDTQGFDLSEDITRHECLWNGPSWPYATSIALTALYEAFQRGEVLPIGAEEFAKLVHQYAAQQMLVHPDKRAVPWIDENLNPMTGEWIARKVLMERARRDGTKVIYRERGKDYNHSTFCDLVIAGICGFVPRLDGSFSVKPLAPASWEWWCIDGIRFCGKEVTVFFDRKGLRYGKGKGLNVLIDGTKTAITNSFVPCNPGRVNAE